MMQNDSDVLYASACMAYGVFTHAAVMPGWQPNIYVYTGYSNNNNNDKIHDNDEHIYGFSVFFSCLNACMC